MLVKNVAELIPPIIHEVFEPVGIDVNLTDGKYCVISDGTEITYPKPLRTAKIKLGKLQYHNRNKQLGDRKKGIAALVVNYAVNVAIKRLI